MIPDDDRDPMETINEDFLASQADQDFYANPDNFDPPDDDGREADETDDARESAAITFDLWAKP